MTIEKVLDRARSNLGRAVEMIRVFVGYAAISKGSVDGKHAEQVFALVDAVEQHLTDLLKGVDGQWRVDVRRHEVDGAFPCLTAEWSSGDHLANVLVYGHGDVQPAGPAKEWLTHPHAAVEHQGRLYGRGTSDDIGGWYSHLVAVKSWLECRSKLPVNVRLIIEFEEEIGSPKLAAQIEQIEADRPGFFDVDAIILTDCENVSVEEPAFTRSLRGVVEADVRCRRSDRTGVHPSLALCSIVSELMDANDGRPTFSLLHLREAERRELAQISEARRQSGQDADAPLIPQRDERSDMEWAWRQPALTVTGLSLPSTTEAKETNCIRPQVALKLQHPDDDDLRQAVDTVLLERSALPGVTFAPSRSSSSGQVEAKCSTGRQGDGHSGLYGSIWPDPSCLMLSRVARFVRQLEEGGQTDLCKRTSIVETSLPTIDGPSDAVCARLSIRTPPGTTVDEVLDEVEHIILRAAARQGVDAEFKRRKDSGHAEAWLYEIPDCAAIDAARHAYRAVWGQDPAEIGVGGSIPFIKTIADLYGATTPLILNGVLDPESALHAPNESLHLGVFKKAVLTNIRLLEEFGNIPKGQFLKKAS